ncbi:YaiO family outer membrane beta-barrel protein [Tenacibaculum sp. M341]|uniref:YaiO family outer membrane beta-barrel protein n=2 Tax=Tenacibaculum TaxID=104267 RepID=UPI001048ACE8|nr:YaiO family outer membrane beta-barrel protein [Tenacibaculum sp. M341]TCI84466.1 YaiO family outer membrane beta-barrel protein [Tenacibaculum sp. M341]
MKRKIILLPILYFIFTYNSFSQTENETTYLEKAQRLVQKKEYRKAADACLSGLKITPENLDLKEYLGKSYLELGKLDSARYILRKVVETKEKNKTALKHLINTEYISKRFSSAICYVNELLEQVPYDKQLWLRKINIYNDMGNTEEAFNTVKRLKSIFPKDIVVNNTYNELYLKRGDTLLNGATINNSKSIYESLLNENPNDKDTYLLLVKDELSQGNKLAALNYIEKGLRVYPKDKDFIKKKVGILESLNRYNEALVYLENKKQDKELFNLYLYILNKAKGYYKNQDVYELQKKEYTVTGNKKELAKLVDMAIAKGLHSEALYYINQGLKRNENDIQILALKLNLYKASKDNNNYEKLLDQLHKVHPNHSDFKEKYNRLAYNRGKSALLVKEYTPALKEFSYLSTESDYKLLALENMLTIYQQQKRHQKALELIEKLTVLNPEKTDRYLFKKATIYQQQKKYNDALAIAKKLLTENPDIIEYENLFSGISEAYVADLMKNKQYKKALEVITEVITLKSTPYLHNQAIIAAIAIKDYERAIAFAEIAKETNTDDKQTLLKLAEVYLKTKEHDKAIDLLTFLHKSYPFDGKIKASLAKALFLKGAELEQQQNVDLALKYYLKSIEIGDKENPAIHSVADMYLRKKEPKKLVTLFNQLEKEEKVNKQLWYKKGVAFELLKQPDSALYYFEKHTPTLKDYEAWNHKLNSLTYASLKNQLDFSYTNNQSDFNNLKSNIGSIRYTRFTPKNSFFAEVNHISRNEEVALQLHLGWFHTLSKTLYTRISYAISDQIFPNHKITASVFKSLKNDFELEVGAQLIFFNESNNILTGVLGASKTIDDFWLNAKLFLVASGNNTVRNNILLQSRYFVNNSDYVSLMVSTGSTPFDENLDFQNGAFYNLTNTMYGAGYYKQINKKLVVGAQLNQFSFKTTDDQFLNQTGLFFVLKTKF